MKCCKCGIKLTRKDAKKLKDGKYCKKCYIEKRNKNREYLKRNILGIKKRIKPEERFLPLKKEKKVQNYLTLDEKHLIFSSSIKKGMNGEEAGKRVKDLVNYLRELRTKVKEDKISNRELNERFKEEFGKLIR